MPMPINPKVAERTLLEVADLLTARGLRFFLMQGTALGAYRDKGFVPNEADIDLGFYQEEFTPQAPTLIKDLDDAGFKVRGISTPYTQIRTIKAKRGGVPFDLVSFIKWRDKRYTTNTDPKTKRYSIVHEAKMLETLEVIEMFGREFYVPSPIEEYLEREYSPTWKTPLKDSVSRTRIYEFERLHNIPYNLLDWDETT